jgi:hypothetical protein
VKVLDFGLAKLTGPPDFLAVRPENQIERAEVHVVLDWLEDVKQRVPVE